MNRNTAALKAKAQECIVTPLDRNKFRVESPSGNAYIVRPVQAHCECEWNRRTERACVHLLAIEIFTDSLRGRSTAVHQNLDDAKRQRRPRSHLGDLILTHRKVKSETQFTWLKGRMKQSYRYGYDADVAVYIRFVKGAEMWTIFNGLPGYAPIRLAQDAVVGIVKCERDGDQRPIVAANQIMIEWAYQRSLGQPKIS